MLSADDPERFVTMNACASVRSAAGFKEDAVYLFREALAGREALLGRNNPRTLVSLQSLATVLTDLGRHVEAEPLHREALDVRTRQLGADHPKTLSSLAISPARYLGRGERQTRSHS
jgi:hypothetical protein